MASSWYAQPPDVVMKELRSSERGLTREKAVERLSAHGFNALPEEKTQSIFRLFLNQFQSSLIYLLLAAGAVVFALGELVDGSIIIAVLLFNAVVGAIQEGRSQHTLRALKQFITTSATVVRDGKEFIISDREVVPGDILILQEGDKVPADARVISSQNLTLDEASLTGESEPVQKVHATIERTGLPAAEQRNMVFRGTNIVAGNGRAIVVATGTSTVIGAIAVKISGIKSEIPLKANIRYLSRAIIVAVASISALLFISGMVLGHTVREMFGIIVALSVSIIPEGLPIVMTLVLATGVWRMSKRHALVKKLQAVEALGQARIIAVDKTGTITKNELVIRSAWMQGSWFDVDGIGYQPAGDIKHGGMIIRTADYPDLLDLAKAAALSANARIRYAEEEKQWRIAGDPTEAALLVFSEKVGFHYEDVLNGSPRVDEIPFSYRLKYHATVHMVDGTRFLAAAGAPEAIFDHCRNFDRAAAETAAATMSERGLRVLAVAAQRDAPQNISAESLGNLSFMGLVGMQDALRPEVADALVRAREAGMRIVMITGDHKLTARAIAREAGIYHEGDEILTGVEIDALSDPALAGLISRVSVFARVTPEHKLRIITAYKHHGEIVAMTGDGVNDAPSLVAADLGVAMGKIGTEVAKEAADIILLDDNFGSIVSAVEEGRSIYKTIKKVILYLFSTSIGEVLTITVGLFLGYPVPLLAAQIIWLNFVTDGFLDVALAMEPKETNLLRGSFEHPKKYLIDARMVQRMAFMAIPMMIGTLLLFREYYQFDLAKAWTISLTTLAVFQWFNAWNCRSEDRSIFHMNPFSNKFLVGATLMVIVFQFTALYNPFMQKFLRTVPLELSDWLLIVPVAASIVVAEELRKLFQRKSAIIKP